MNRRAAPGFHDLPEAEDDDVALETFDSHNNSVIHEEATISLMVLGCIAGIATVIILLSAVLLWRRYVILAGGSNKENLSSLGA
jgi:hypothetical protein